MENSDGTTPEPSLSKGLHNINWYSHQRSNFKQAVNETLTFSRNFLCPQSKYLFSLSGLRGTTQHHNKVNFFTTLRQDEGGKKSSKLLITMHKAIIKSFSFFSSRFHSSASEKFWAFVSRRNGEKSEVKSKLNAFSCYISPFGQWKISFRTFIKLFSGLDSIFNALLRRSAVNSTFCSAQQFTFLISPK